MSIFPIHFFYKIDVCKLHLAQRPLQASFPAPALPGLGRVAVRFRVLRRNYVFAVEGGEFVVHARVDDLEELGARHPFGEGGLLGRQ